MSYFDMSHIYQTQIKSEENLQMVLTAIENFNVDRLLEMYQELTKSKKQNK